MRLSERKWWNADGHFRMWFLQLKPLFLCIGAAIDDLPWNSIVKLLHDERRLHRPVSNTKNGVPDRLFNQHQRRRPLIPQCYSSLEAGIRKTGYQIKRQGTDANNIFATNSRLHELGRNQQVQRRDCQGQMEWLPFTTGFSRRVAVVSEHFSPKVEFCLTQLRRN